MCGIVAYIGSREAETVLLNGLKRLEYRGYDSSGIAVVSGNRVVIDKKKGKVTELEESISNRDVKSNIGIGHTRWATHGPPNDLNAHPHTSSDKKIALVHNGIIENYLELKTYLTNQGYVFESDTDTEVLVKLIEEVLRNDDISFSFAVQIALAKVSGAFAIAVLHEDFQDQLVAARRSSPLVIGLGQNELFVASDATPIVEYTDSVIYLKDNEVATLYGDGKYQITNLKNENINSTISKLTLKIAEIEKDGYNHFMQKEIFQQPTTVLQSTRGRLNIETNQVRLGGVEENIETFLKADRIIFVACGTSWHSALIGEYFIETLARINVEVEYASEFRYRNPILNKNDIVIAVSQSGETADTLAALELAKERGVFTYGIVNVVGSSIARLTDSGSYLHAGPEIGVASTKAFTSQTTVLLLMALYLAKLKKATPQIKLNQIARELYNIPNKIKKILNQEELIKQVAYYTSNAQNALYLGRGYNFPVALEGALKLKEISYIHAEGYPAAEMKHGPIALIDDQMPVIILATNESAYDKMLNNIQEVKARNAIVIAIVPEDDKFIKTIANYTITIPKTEEVLSPLLSVIPLQILAYHIADMRKCNVDQPRNLAKSVTVE